VDENGTAADERMEEWGDFEEYDLQTVIDSFGFFLDFDFGKKGENGSENDVLFLFF
jgi:hypothetical protein